jgi:hypothetical protein
MDGGVEEHVAIAAGGAWRSGGALRNREHGQAWSMQEHGRSWHGEARITHNGAAWRSTEEFGGA